MRISKFVANLEAQNALWLISGKICQMILSLVVSILTARYLGPSNYGIINYAGAYVAFFTSLCTLGINSVIVKNFVDNPIEEGETLGTTIILRIISSIMSAFIIVVIVFFVDTGDTEVVVVTALCTIGLIFQVFDSFNYWFQSKYKSRYTAIATFVAYFCTSIYRIILLISKANIYYFALATSIDHLVLAFLLYLFYRMQNGQRLAFSILKGRELLSKSYHYILAGMMVAIYSQTDKLMLKQMMDEAEVGYYSVATSICAMWVFILTAIIDSMYPTILRLFNENTVLFNKKNKQLYALVFYISCFVSICFLLLSDFAIRILYGAEYLPAANPLKIITWYTAFSYMGVARNAWIVCYDKQHYLKYMYISAAIINVILNYFLIPILGASGAAIASLITQVSTCIILPSFITDMRPNVKLMFEAIALRGIK